MIDQKFVIQDLNRRGEIRFSEFSQMDFIPEKIYDHLTASINLLNRLNNTYGKLKYAEPQIKALIVKLDRMLKEAKVTVDKIDDLL